MDKEIKVAIRKTDKYAVSTGGDTVEIIERPKGGVSVVLADAQGSGRSAKINSLSVVSTILNLISEGVRDGAAARAAHDKLFSRRGGRVSSTLAIASIDLHTNTLVISRNGNCPIIIWCKDKVYIYEKDIAPIGFHYESKPEIAELEICDDLWVFSCSDGITHAGRHTENEMSIQIIIDLVDKGRKNNLNIDEISDSIIQEALIKDKDRPKDDMSMFLMNVKDYSHRVLVRKMGISFPYKGGRYGK
ncbi:MAG: PP2C family protein-serine/threonine phosphatase [Clostridia bacterium]